MRENFIKISLTAKESTFLKMEEHIQVILKIIKCTVKVFMFGQIKNFIEEIICLEKDMDTEA